MDWQDVAGKVFVFYFTKARFSAESATKKAFEAVMAWETLTEQLTEAWEEEVSNAGSGTASDNQG